MITDTIGTPVNAAALRKILRAGGVNPAVVHYVRTQGGETSMRFSTMGTASRGARVLRAAWTDGARRVTRTGGWVRIVRAGAADVPPAPPKPEQFEPGEHAWSWLIWSVLHNGGELDGFAPEMPMTIEHALLPTQWVALGPARTTRPGVHTVIVSDAGWDLVRAGVA